MQIDLTSNGRKNESIEHSINLYLISLNERKMKDLSVQGLIEVECVYTQKIIKSQAFGRKATFIKWVKGNI